MIEEGSRQKIIIFQKKNCLFDFEFYVFSVLSYYLLWVFRKLFKLILKLYSCFIQFSGLHILSELYFQFTGKEKCKNIWFCFPSKIAPWTNPFFFFYFSLFYYIPLCPLIFILFSSCYRCALGFVLCFSFVLVRGFI